MNSSAPDGETQHKHIHLVIKNKKVNIIKDLTKFLRNLSHLMMLKMLLLNSGVMGNEGGLQGMGDFEYQFQLMRGVQGMY